MHSLLQRFHQLPSGRDKVLTTLFLFGIPLIGMHELCNVVPYYIYTEQFNPFMFPIHVVITLFFYYNIYGNHYQLMRCRHFVDNNSNHSPCGGGAATATAAAIVFANNLPTESNATIPLLYKHCDKCHATVPERSHHCVLCNICIDRRDHHCWFSGTCIGARNYRYYIVMIAYAWLAGLYASVYNVAFYIGTFQSWTYFCLTVFIPHVLMVLGYFTVPEFIVALCTSLNVLLMLIVSMLFFIQLIQLTHGQTAYERKRNIVLFHRGGVLQNWREVLGERWLAVWFHPFVHSPINVAAQLKPHQM